MLASVRAGARPTSSGYTTPYEKAAFLQSLTADTLSGSMGYHGHSSSPGGVVKAQSVHMCIAAVCARLERCGDCRQKCCVSLLHILWLQHSLFLSAPRPLRHWPPEQFVLETFALPWSGRSFEMTVSGGQIISRTVLGRGAAVTLRIACLVQHSLPSPAGRPSPKALEIKFLILVFTFWYCNLNKTTSLLF